jgi:hypothetical protein
MTTRHACCALLLALLGGLAGCGKYRIAFQVQDAINTGGGSAADAEQLDVDIVCLTKADIDKLPGLVENRVWSDEWFAMRDKNQSDVRALAKHIFALRNGEKGPNDVLLGPALVPGRVSKETERVVEIVHPAGLAGSSAMVILGRFKDAKGGLRRSPPVIVKPLPTWHPEIKISVGPIDMTRTE